MCYNMENDFMKNTVTKFKFVPLAAEQANKWEIGVVGKKGDFIQKASKTQKMVD